MKIRDFFKIRSDDTISAVVIDGRLYEPDCVTPLTDAALINGVLMREVGLKQVLQAMVDRG